MFTGCSSNQLNPDAEALWSGLIFTRQSTITSVKTTAGEFKISWWPLACFGAAVGQLWWMCRGLLTPRFSLHQHSLIHAVCDTDIVRGAGAGGLASRNNLQITTGNTEELVLDIGRQSHAPAPVHEEGSPEPLYEIPVIPVTLERGWRQGRCLRFMSNFIKCCFSERINSEFELEHLNQPLQNFSLKRRRSEANNLLI